MIRRLYPINQRLGMFLILFAMCSSRQQPYCECFFIPRASDTIMRSRNQNRNQLQQQIRLNPSWPSLPLPVVVLAKTKPPVARTSSSSLSAVMMMMMIPSLALMPNNNDIYRVGGMAGMIGLLCQCGLTKLFQRYSLTRENAGYTAHTVVALLLMTYIAAIGSIGWFGSTFPSTPFDRLLLPNGQCQYIAAIVTGLLLIWDIPTSVRIRSLRKVDSLVHHIIMTITSYFAATIIPMHYVYFYFGVSELSSIPLLVYDQLCIWTKNNSNTTRIELESTAVISTTTTTTEPIMMNEQDMITNTKFNNMMIQWRDRVQMFTAICFTIIRAILFSYVTIRHFIPDVLSILTTMTNGNNKLVAVTALAAVRPVQMRTLRFALVASIGFTSLQLYWFMLMLQTIYKQVANQPSSQTM